AGIVTAVGNCLPRLAVASNVLPAEPNHCLRGHAALDDSRHDGGAFPDASQVSGPESDAGLFPSSTHVARSRARPGAVRLLFSNPNIYPLPIAILKSLRYKFEPTAAAAGVFAIALVVLSMLLTNRLTNLARFAGIKFS